MNFHKQGEGALRKAQLNKVKIREITYDGSRRTNGQYHNSVLITENEKRDKIRQFRILEYENLMNEIMDHGSFVNLFSFLKVLKLETWILDLEVEVPTSSTRTLEN
uniref:Uncharacterized protein n=1 Tax=Cacopsylla melanoneura TaxID=428564 RepID=A0A8D8QSW2_9HEMI